jgi:hypothetical protein
MRGIPVAFVLAGGYLGPGLERAGLVAEAARVPLMPNYVLLLGAEFSRNWDAPLAAEVANSLLEEVADDTHLQALLRRHSKNFEIPHGNNGFPRSSHRGPS